MIYKQFKSFIDNEDSSSISYRKFNDKEADLYPTFSFCFEFAWGGEMFKDERFLGIGLDTRSDRRPWAEERHHQSSSE